MFNLSDFEKKSNKTLLKYFETANNPPQIYSYGDLHVQSIQLSAALEEVLRNITSQSTQSTLNLNIAILLPVHSPAILPALVG